MQEYGFAVRTFYTEIQDFQLDDIETQKEETLKRAKQSNTFVQHDVKRKSLIPKRGLRLHISNIFISFSLFHCHQVIVLISGITQRWHQ